MSREFGGAAELALRLAADADRRVPDSAMVWLPGPGRSEDKARALALPVRYHAMPDIRRHSKFRRAVMNLKTGAQLRRGRPGILHVHSLLAYAALPLACAVSGLKRVVHVHLDHDEATIRWAFRWPPEMIVTCARFLADQVRAALPETVQESTRIVPVPNCIDIDKHHPGERREAKAHVGAPLDRPLMLMLANLAPHKGQSTAIQVTAELKERGIDVVCWLGGVERDPEGGFAAELNELIDTSGVGDHVRLLGFRSDGPELLRAADFFLLPSVREGLPLAVLEAQASGVPVLAAPAAGTPEVVADGETGFLIAADDARGYADRIARLIANPEEYRSIADKALTQCRANHNATAYADRVWELYQELLA